MKKVIVIILVFIVLFTGFSCYKPKSGETGKNEFSERKIKILHIMSYHTPWKWTDDQFNGFKEPLKDLDIEYKIFQMDTKNRSSIEWMEQVGVEARNLIDTWKPDLVYTNDDNAQIYVTSHYINSEIPFVFSAVNNTPESYGFVGSSNIAGVLELPHVVPGLKLMQQIIPSMKNIAVITDDARMWEPVMEYMKVRIREMPEVNVVSWDIINTFAEYKNKLKGYEGTIDCVAILGIFDFKDQDGNNVPLDDVLRWTAENSKVPDFSFWRDRVEKGTLCAVTVSGYEQGLAAGKIARGILVEGKKPSDFPFQPTTKGEPLLSQARIEKLGIIIESDLLFTVEVLDTFVWEK